MARKKNTANDGLRSFEDAFLLLNTTYNDLTSIVTCLQGWCYDSEIWELTQRHQKWYMATLLDAFNACRANNFDRAYQICQDFQAYADGLDHYLDLKVQYDEPSNPEELVTDDED